MKLSSSTLSILKNFSGINQGLIINAGSELATMPREKSVYACAKLPESFPVSCQIWNLPLFLQVFSALDEPDIEWFEDHAILVSGPIRWKFVYGRNVEPVPPKYDDIKTKFKFDAEFQLTRDELIKITKMIGILGAETIDFSVKDGVASIDLKGSNSACDTLFTLKLDAEFDPDISVKVSILRGIFNVIQSSYTISVSDTSIMMYSGDWNLTYIMAGATVEE